LWNQAVAISGAAAFGFVCRKALPVCVVFEWFEARVNNAGPCEHETSDGSFVSGCVNHSG